MPRRRASRSPSQDLEQQQQQQQQPQSHGHRPSLEGIEATFFGETSSSIIHDQSLMAQNVYGDGGGDGNGDGDGNGNGNGNGDGNVDGNVDVDGDGDGDGDVEMSGNGQHEVDAAVPGGSNSTPTRGRTSKRKRRDFENAPVNLNELRLRQLKEDRDAYYYDLGWCQDILDRDDLTPTESRTFQMRQLDLGHQLRMTNHRIAEYEAEMQNHRFFGAATSTSGRQHPSYTTAYNPRTSFMNAEPPQERRGPGRPPGSKNRPKDAVFTPGPQLPSSNAQKAAALASAGAKRTLPTEIRVATPNGGATENPSKRPRIEVGSPIGSATEDDNENDNDMEGKTNTVATETAHRSPEDEDNKDEVIKATHPRRTQARDTTKDDVRSQKGSAFTVVNNKSNNKNINASSGGAASAPSTPAHALPTRGTPASKNKNMGPPKGTQTPANNDTAEQDPTGPKGSKYQRLGHHMCQLCTSQKYLMQTTPKQPSEPSSWPLRDISKMVTHYTRMHGEHNKMERCMELGRALEDNRGPFRYWLQETKRVKVSLPEVNEAIRELNHGHLPELLRRLSNAARAFPKD